MHLYSFDREFYSKCLAVQAQSLAQAVKVLFKGSVSPMAVLGYELDQGRSFKRQYLVLRGLVLRQLSGYAN